MSLRIYFFYLQSDNQAVKMLSTLVRLYTFDIFKVGNRMVISWMMTKADYAGEIHHIDSRPYPLSPVPFRSFILCLCSKLHGISGSCERFMKS